MRDDSHGPEVGSGSGGPAVYLATARGCHVTGVDINEHGIRNGEWLALARRVAVRMQFHTGDASKPLPFPAATLGAVISNDAMCHISNLLEILGDWHRVLRAQGHPVHGRDGDPGLMSQEEVAIRSSIGFYLVLPPGENGRRITRAGFALLGTEDPRLRRRLRGAGARRSRATSARDDDTGG